MEISSSPMTERQRNYRATYRHRIAGWYNGWLHAFVIYVIGFTALSVYFANISDLRWWELGIVPVTFLAANFFEWWIHRFVMHRPSQVKAFRAIYNRHTLMHHQFFTEQDAMRSAAQQLAGTAAHSPDGLTASDSALADRFATLARTCVACHSAYLHGRIELQPQWDSGLACPRAVVGPVP